MKTEFTKGEWTTKITDTNSYAGDLVFSDTGQLICDCNISNALESECAANAKLISAAPDLLEAVQSLLTMMERGAKPKKLNETLTWIENDKLARSKALAALKKATE